MTDEHEKRRLDVSFAGPAPRSCSPGANVKISAWSDTRSDGPNVQYSL